MTRDQSEVTNNTSSNNATTANKQKIKCKNTKKNVGLSRYTYADYVILSSTIAYAIGEELSDEDLALLIVFLSQVSADLALIRTKRAIELSQSSANQVEESDILDVLDVEDTLDDIPILVRNKTKRKNIKKTKVKKKKT
ncbi:hypothetical protein UT300012_11000 [Paraclostridium bifermentans]|uniref:hypothetical protein n=1 Tax=Paraclostridium bifermentans TaxID=1490 RepID=UPI000DF7D47B|nr:hypothetical protein [Paraclostridium bifermentans]MBS5952389.1 hypothetical protein [Paraclostridium bifermentans]MBU5287783.1 hypothetical protein [Paraclostridium bifermentans]RDC49408.1 hypothetical protein DVA85_23940 [Acinetobacter sp. RIT592]